MKRSGDELPVSRRKVLRSLPPAYPDGASPLYALLVPYGNSLGLDHAVVSDLLTTEDLVKPNEWHRVLSNFARIQQWFDVIQLANCCKHARYNIKTHWEWIHLKRCSAFLLLDKLGAVLDGAMALEKWLKIFVGLELTSNMTLDAYRYQFPCQLCPDQLGLPLLAAYVGYIAVAQWLTPAGTQLNCDAIYALSPLCDHRQFLSAFAFLNRPFVGVADDKLASTIHWPRLDPTWILLGFELERPVVARALVELAGVNARARRWIIGKATRIGMYHSTVRVLAIALSAVHTCLPYEKTRRRAQYREFALAQFDKNVATETANLYISSMREEWERNEHDDQIHSAADDEEGNSIDATPSQ
jgi:hypothetical protein